MTPHQILEVTVVYLSAFVAVSAATVLGLYWHRGHRMRWHVLAMIASYLMLTFVISYNVMFRHVLMPDVTAVAAIVGFLVGDVALAVLLLDLLDDD